MYLADLKGGMFVPTSFWGETYKIIAVKQ